MAETKKKTTKVVKEAPKKEIKTEKKISDSFAVIKTGGKQYIVEAGRFYDFEKLNVEEGKAVSFDEVLLTASGKEIKVGEPFVAGAKVTGKVLEQRKDDKVIVFKYKPKKRYRKTQGHRQQKTRVEITKMG